MRWRIQVVGLLGLFGLRIGFRGLGFRVEGWVWGVTGDWRDSVPLFKKCLFFKTLHPKP